MLILVSCFFKVNAEEVDTNSIYGLNPSKTKPFLSKEEINFYIFASFSLNDNVLKQMIDYAKTYDTQIVFRGLENNSFKLTAEHIQKIVKEDDEASIIIDPTLFTKFEIKQVPSFILAKEEACADQMSCSSMYDKISGNVTPKFALEKFAEKGELSDEAMKILEEGR